MFGGNRSLPLQQIEKQAFQLPFRAYAHIGRALHRQSSGVEIRREQSAVFGRTPGAVAETSSEAPDRARRAAIRGKWNELLTAAQKGCGQSCIGAGPLCETGLAPVTLNTGG